MSASKPLSRRSSSLQAGTQLAERDSGSRWLRWIVVAGVLIVPVFISPAGQDTFRYPKELALRFEVIALLTLLAVLGILRQLHLPRVAADRGWLVLVALVGGWATLSAALATNHLVSIPAAARVLSLTLLFGVTVLVLRGQPTVYAAWIVPSALVNVVVYLLQELDVWQPLAVGAMTERHVARTGLIGNPNDVGSYLVAPTLVATCLALTQRRRRSLWFAGATFLLIGIFITQTVTAIGAVAFGLVVMAALRLGSWRRMLLVAALAAVVATTVVLTYRPLRQRAELMRGALLGHDYETLSAARSLPFLAAIEMALDHPAAGIGPGGFAYNFFDYKLRIQQRHRQLFGPGITDYNFAEVHSDHLQVLAETGVPGYLLFLAAIFWLAAQSRRPPVSAVLNRNRPPPDYVRLLSLPLAVSFFILTLAQFPLELAAPTGAFVWSAATACAWRHP